MSFMMTFRAGTAAVTIASFALAGCANRSTIQPLTVIVHGQQSSCAFEVNGRTLTSDELLATARTELKPGRSTRIIADTKAPPYRCIGGAIYLLQSAGFTDASFPAEAAATRQ